MNGTTWAARAAWLGGPTLTEDVSITVEGGLIVSLSTQPEAASSRLDGIILPGLVNAHSHAFHRLLRGRTHRQSGDFWLWRNLMFQTAERLTPETYEEVATAVYIEMALAGVTAVGEFHYLHHQADGRPYADPNEMGHALIRAARRAGIRICLLDAGYFRAGFGNEALHPVQERFRDPSAGDWLDRVDDLFRNYTNDDDVVIGVAPHSVRAVPPEDLGQVAKRVDRSHPVHIHVSEQPAENRDCLEATGMTPTALLGEAGLLGTGTTLVHATHLTPDDITDVGASGSGVCYCATTERDLADGLGPAAKLAAAGASLAVGSDSHAVIDLFEETRGMEMHQRLLTGRRGVMDPSALMAAVTLGGARSLGFGEAGLVEGAPADFVVIDPDNPRLMGLDATSVDSIVFGATAADVSDTFVGGKRIVADRQHEGWTEAQRSLAPPGK